MRNFSTLSRAPFLKAAVRSSYFKPLTGPPSVRLPPALSRSLAQVKPDREVFPDIYFTSAKPPIILRVEGGSKAKDHTPPDERTLKLGKTLRILQERLPSLLASPLPQDILSPHISLHLFPSTHPHLPTASGRVAYHAALWTSPVAWGRVPFVGNVKLIILSERVVKGSGGYPRKELKHASVEERLIVRWKTCGKTKAKRMGVLYRGIGASEQVDKITEWLGGDARDEEFCGLFIFEFDEEGRVLSHTIEHVDENRHWEKTSKVVSITDWLLGRMNGRGKEKVPEFALEFSNDKICKRGNHDKIDQRRNEA